MGKNYSAVRCGLTYNSGPHFKRGIRRQGMGNSEARVESVLYLQQGECPQPAACREL